MSPEFTFDNIPDEYYQKLAIIEKYIFKLEDNDKKYNYVRLGLSKALRRVIEGNHKSSIQYLQNIIDEMRKEVIFPKRISFFKSAGISTAILCLIAWIFFKNNSQLAGTNSLLVREAIYCMSFSSLGNLFLHSTKFYEIEDSEKNLGYLQGFISFLRSTINGFVVYVVIKSGLLLGDLADKLSVILVFSLVSGFSDDILIRLLTNLSKKMTDNDSSTEPKEIASAKVMVPIDKEADGNNVIKKLREEKNKQQVIKLNAMEKMEKKEQETLENKSK